MIIINSSAYKTAHLPYMCCWHTYQRIKKKRQYKLQNIFCNAKHFKKKNRLTYSIITNMKGPTIYNGNRITNHFEYMTFIRCSMVTVNYMSLMVEW